MAGDPTLPEGIAAEMHRFSTHASENTERAKYFLSSGGFIEQGIKSGVIKGVPPRSLGGLDKGPAGIEALHAEKIGIHPRV